MYFNDIRSDWVHRCVSDDWEPKVAKHLSHGYVLVGQMWKAKQEV